VVNSTDEVAARQNARSFLNPAPLSWAYDFNRDGFVNATDQILARSNSTTLATSLHLIAPPLAASGLAEVYSGSTIETLSLAAGDGLGWSTSTGEPAGAVNAFATGDPSPLLAAQSIRGVDASPCIAAQAIATDQLGSVSSMQSVPARKRSTTPDSAVAEAADLVFAQLGFGAE